MACSGSKSRCYRRNARVTGSSANITDTFTNTSGGIGTVLYTVIPTRAGCTGPAVDIVIKVNSEPVLNPGLNKSACSNESIG